MYLVLGALAEEFGDFLAMPTNDISPVNHPRRTLKDFTTKKGPLVHFDPVPRLLLCLPMIMHFDTTFGGIASQRCSAAVATTVITSVKLAGI
jgi:hypothetical protein